MRRAPLFVGVTWVVLCAVPGIVCSRAWESGQGLSVVHNEAQPDPIYTNLSWIGDGEGGFPAGWLHVNDAFGNAIGRIGDINNDSVTDFVVGAPFDNNDVGDEAGAVYVLQMTPQRTVDRAFKITKGLRGFTGDQDAGCWFGYSADGVGDVDGDGVEDIAVGAPIDQDAEVGAGAVFVMLMEAGVHVKATVKITTGQGGFNLTLKANDNFGTGLAGVGDIDGNGVPDLAVGAENDDTGGAVYVLLMLATGNVSSATKIANVLSASASQSDNFGRCVAALGDVNHDGVPDIAVGASWADRGGQLNAGSVYILHMAPNGTVAHHYEITSHTSGFNHSLVEGEEFASPSRVGDVDGDGINDLVVGAFYSTCSAYVLLMDGDGLVRDFHQITNIDMGGFGSSVSFVERGTGVSLLVGAPSPYMVTSTVYVVDLADRSSVPWSSSSSTSFTSSTSVSASITPSPSPSARDPGDGGSVRLWASVGGGIAACLILVVVGLLAIRARRKRARSRAGFGKDLLLDGVAGEEGGGSGGTLLQQQEEQLHATPADGEEGKAADHIPMPPGKQFHAFLSHDWGDDHKNHELVSKINDALKARGVVTWFDNDRMSGDIANQIAAGIDNSCVVVVFVTRHYIDKVAQSLPDNCKAEFNFATNQRKPLIAVVTDKRARNVRDWRGPVGVHLCQLLYHDLCERQPDKDKVDKLTHEIRAKCAQQE